MSGFDLKQMSIFTAIIAAAFAVVFFLSGFVSQNKIMLPETYDDSDLSFQGKKLKGFALGAEGLLADWYWMRSLQYIGGKIVKTESDLNIEDLSALNPRLLYPLLDNATDLDPKFMAAYSYGASVLPVIDRDLALKLTEKGIVNNPDAWRLYQYLGYIYWRAKDFKKAAEIYDKGSQIDGAPSFMKQMSAAMQAQGGSRETARLIYSQMLAEAEDQQSRNNAELRLKQLDSMDELDAINSILKKQSECPGSLSAIMPMLRNVTLPHGNDFKLNEQRQLIDPSGAPYYFDHKTCSAFVDLRFSKIPRF
ncbi:MAG: tetratricopeptide repeat protein [Pyrinomonadaceae bacterium]